MATKKSEKPVLLCTARMLWVPRHPIPDPVTGETIAWKHGKIRQGQRFLWHGDPHSIPVGAEFISGKPRGKKVPEEETLEVRLARAEQARIDSEAELAKLKQESENLRVAEEAEAKKAAKAKEKAEAKAAADDARKLKEADAAAQGE